jgi:6-phosphogluconolactonase/glucosamine-6-phosphate isomerase/deaminase
VNQYTKRITVTHTFLRDVVDEAIIYAVGDEKKNYIEQIEQGAHNVKEFPASVVTHMKSARLYTSQ